MIRLCLCALAFVVCSWAFVLADDGDKLPPAAEGEMDFVKDIQPILKENCHKCHGATKQRGDLRLDQKAAAMKGGESFAPAIIPGEGAESPLVRMAAGLIDGMQMPPEGESKLTKKQIGKLRGWIDQGAKWPDDPAPKDEPSAHWSFRPLNRTIPPLVTSQNLAWARNAVDPFIAAKLQDVRLERDGSIQGMSPSEEADRRSLIRRATFDLIGLPPTPDEVIEFLDEPRPDAFERLSDRLLASPHFGERWARHWLDAVRFAESDGFETNQPRPNAWHYRDYVIRAFNEDKPFGRFLFEQLAGDTVGVDEATGFLVGGAMDRVKSPDPTLTAQQRADELHDMISTTGSAFFGLTVGCARCHNHKFDPITQSDYYSLKAVFAGVQHGERPLLPPDYEKRRQTAESVERELANVRTNLMRYEPLAFVAETVARQNLPRPTLPESTILIDDDLPSMRPNGGMSITYLVPRIGLEPHRKGTDRGQQDDPGSLSRYPNLGRNYSYWNNVASKDVMTWNPGVGGQWRLWLSWGCGWDTHAADAQCLLDQDGDLSTTDDQRLIAKVDQRRFADGSGGSENQPLWSGFFDAGTYSLTANSRIVLRGGESAAYVTGDLLCLQRADIETGLPKSNLPSLRSSVQRQANVERFPPVRARFVKFVIDATTGGSPCIDELEVFTSAAAGSLPKNIALSSLGTKATSSSNLPGYEIHQLAFVNDGRYGNSASWISNEPAQGWVQLEFPAAIEIDRIVWSRDRPDNGQYQDRIPTKYRIEAGLSTDSMRVVASSDDRLSFDRKIASMPTSTGRKPEDEQAVSALALRQSALTRQLQSLTTMPMAYAGRFVVPESTFRLHRGDPMQPREPSTPGAISAIGTAWKLPAEANDAERRRSLANWITHEQHPLTVRVMVNRLWHFHFGQGLVTTPSDFGRNGALPSHPGLLDWLASEARSGSSPKRLHRLIVTSATYRQSSASRSDGLTADAGNRYLWRYPPRRLEAESIRDAMLMVSGNLDDQMYGPGFDLFEPNTNYVKVYNSKRDLGPKEWRRMVYQSKPRMQLDEIFGQFDCPDAGQITPKRTSSITALQALNLMNSQFVVSQSSQFANRLSTESGNDATALATRAFCLAFQREPSEEELKAAVDLIEQHGANAFCRAILNANEFLFVF